MKSLLHIALAGAGLVGSASAWAEEPKPTAEPAAKAAAPTEDVAKVAASPVVSPAAEPAKAAAPVVETSAAPAATTPAETSVPKAPESDKAPVKTIAKTSQDVAATFDHQIAERILTTYYSNNSQARLKLGVQKRYDPMLAKLREYFIAEMTGSGISEAFVFDADDLAYRTQLLGILEKFKAEATKSGELTARMNERKKKAEANLSRAETELVLLRAEAAPNAKAIASLEADVATLRQTIVVSEELSKMKVISGQKMGIAKINMNHAEYPFIASFEPGLKQLYILKAGYGMQMSSGDVDFYIDLVKRLPEFKERLLEGEAKDARLHAEIKAIFENETK